MKFCGSVTTMTEQFDEKLINDYILWMREKKNKDTTINSKMTNLRPFLY